MKQVTISKLNVSITSNEEGMFNLNDLWHQAKLEEKKRPSQWRNDVRKMMEQTANLQSDKQGNGNTTWASEQAVYAYAMFVSPEFYMAVVEAFTALVNGNVVKAKKIAKAEVNVHRTMLMQRPRKQIAKYFEGKDVVEGTKSFIADMGYNQKATHEDRTRVLESLRKYIKSEGRKLDFMAIDQTAKHIDALRLVAEQERFLERLHHGMIKHHSK